MSGLELLVDDIDGRLHAAVVRRGRLVDLFVDAPVTPVAWASIYLGKVLKVDKNLDAAIVDLGNGLSGFLPAKHIHFPDADPSESRTGIADLIKPGQTLLVQVKSEARKGSAHEQHKMPRLTTKLYILGHYAVYCPIARRVTMSRKVTNEKIIALTTKLKSKGGWILHPSANDADEKDILQETSLLEKEWQEIHAEVEKGDGRPRLMKRGPDALARVLLDYGARGFDHIHVGTRNLLNAMMDWSAKNDPALANSKRLRLFKPEKNAQRLFDIHDIYSELEMLEESIVHLNGGGSLIIEPTHALIVIDVNQGSTTNIIEANIEAAREVARQIRLRNLSGAIIVDFINMSQRTERARLTDALDEALSTDSANAQSHGFTRIGILEITRKRRSAMYAEKMRAPAA